MDGSQNKRQFLMQDVVLNSRQCTSDGKILGSVIRIPNQNWSNKSEKILWFSRAKTQNEIPSELVDLVPVEFKPTLATQTLMQVGTKWSPCVSETSGSTFNIVLIGYNIVQ